MPRCRCRLLPPPSPTGGAVRLHPSRRRLLPSSAVHPPPTSLAAGGGADAAPGAVTGDNSRDPSAPLLPPGLPLPSTATSLTGGCYCPPPIPPTPAAAVQRRPPSPPPLRWRPVAAPTLPQALPPPTAAATRRPLVPPDGCRVPALPTSGRSRAFQWRMPLIGGRRRHGHFGRGCRSSAHRRWRPVVHAPPRLGGRLTSWRSSGGC